MKKQTSTKQIKIYKKCDKIHVKQTHWHSYKEMQTRTWKYVNEKQFTG